MLRSVAAVALMLIASATWAQNYPAHPVKVIVPYAVGGSADVYGRVLAAKLSETMGQPFVIENRPGGGAVIGTDAVAKSATDGYTVLVMSNTHTVNESLVPKKPFTIPSLMDEDDGAVNRTVTFKDMQHEEALAG